MLFKSKKPKSADRDFLQEARKNIQSWFDYFSENINKSREDIKFALIDQWDKRDRYERKINGQPVMQFNQLYAHVSAIIGEQRQNTPNIIVHPVSKDSDQQAVNLREGVIRQALYDSKSDVVFQEAFKWCMLGGFGALRVYTEYASPQSFEQSIKIKVISDPTLAFFDPQAERPDKSDGDFCGVYQTMKKETFERKYPDAKVSSDFSPSFSNSERFSWGGDDRVTVAEYFYKKPFKIQMAKLSDGQTLPLDESKAHIKDNNKLVKKGLALPVEIIDTKTVEDYKIIYCKLTHDTILEESEWPSKELPIIFVDGDSFYYDGQQCTKSFIEFAKDAQRYLNYIASESAYAVLTRRRETWVGTPENIKGMSDTWRNPNKTKGILLANPDPRTGLPQKLPPSEIPSTLIHQYERAQNDIQMILGRYEANLGMQGNERSGVAIQNRVKQGNAPTFVYFDNLNRAVESCARVILSLIPNIMDTTRDITIRNKDKSQHIIPVNHPEIDSYRNDLTKGQFTVMVEAGPNYAVQKAEALQHLLQLASINPTIASVLPDLIASNLDIENMPQIVERLKTLVPKTILAKESGQPVPAPAPNPEMEMKQRNMMIEMKKADNEAQRIELERFKLGLSAHTAKEKSNAEIKKANLSYQTAVINHHNKQPTPQPQEVYYE